MTPRAVRANRSAHLALTDRKITGVIAVLALAFATSPLASQQVRMQQVPRDAGTTIRAAARLVEVSVIVAERNGNPVLDLVAGDFSIRDGEEQEIAFLQMHTPGVTSPNPLPPGMVTNRLETKGVPVGIACVIVLDVATTFARDAADAQHMRLYTINFLQQLRPEDRVAIFTVTRSSGLRMIHDFTNDASSLLAVLANWKAFLAGAGSGTGAIAQAGGPLESMGTIPGIDEWFQSAQGREQEFRDRIGAMASASMMSALARYLARIPGRKNLIWVSSYVFGIESELARFHPLMERAIQELNNASVSVYPVDVRGLVGPFDPALAGTPRPPISRREAVDPRAARSRAPNTTWLSMTQDSMVRLAQDTGGRHFINTNDIAGAIRTAIDESRVTYTLGYYPTHGKWDGSYREIQVKVKRPGVTIRHRRGYYAFPDPPATPETIEEAMLAAAVSPLDATAIGLTAQMTPHAANAGGEPREGAAGQRVTLTIEPEDVPLRLEDGRRKATLDVWYVLLDEEGAPHSIAKYPVEVSLDEAGWRAAQATGIREERYMEFPAEARALRIVVRDRVTGVLGSLRMPLPQE